VIVAIEGTSAAGKTTWCQKNAPTLSVPEEPSGRERWKMALAIEHEHGIAVCDTDPAKLYYDYALWRTVRLDNAGWASSCDDACEGFASDELGLPDVTFFAERDVETLVRYRSNDPTRRRHRFWLHAELQPFFKEWWNAVDAVEPGRVFWRYPDSLDELQRYTPRRRRTGADLLDAVLERLPERET
jgi:hypothetical protein